MVGAGLITEQWPCAWPTVYGYLRMARRGQARQAALTAALYEYCRQHELELVTVFTEYGVTGEPLPAAFVGLLDVLSMTGTYGVVVPSEHHLGRSDVVQARRRRITATGSRLLVVRPARAIRAGGGASDRWAWTHAPVAEPRTGWSCPETEAPRAVREPDLLGADET